MGLSAPGTGDAAYTSLSVSPAQQGTIAFWVRALDIGTTQRLLGIDDDFEGRLVSDGELFNEFAQSGSTSSTFGVLTEGTLYHLVSIWDISGGIARSFRDGTLYDTNDSPDSVPSGEMEFFNRVGRSDYFEGDLHDVRIYDRVLTPNEILTLYNSRGRDSIVHGLVHRWVFDEGADGSTFSGSGTGKDRVGKNDADADTGPPTYIYDANIAPRRR